MHKKQKKIGGGDMAAIINKMLNFVGFDTDEDFMDENSEVYEMGESVGKSKNEVVGSQKRHSGKLVSIASSSQTQLVVVQPTSFEDVEDVANHLKNNKPVVMNLEYTDKETSRRMIDFISGTACGINGHIQKVSNNIFLCAPCNIDIMSDFKDERSKSSFSWLK